MYWNPVNRLGLKPYFKSAGPRLSRNGMCDSPSEFAMPGSSFASPVAACRRLKVTLAARGIASYQTCLQATGKTCGRFPAHLTQVRVQFRLSRTAPGPCCRCSFEFVSNLPLALLRQAVKLLLTSHGARKSEFWEPQGIGVQNESSERAFALCNQ